MLLQNEGGVSVTTSVAVETVVSVTVTVASSLVHIRVRNCGYRTPLAIGSSYEEIERLTPSVMVTVVLTASVAVKVEVTVTVTFGFGIERQLQAFSILSHG